jgi:hypothetical protein
MSVVSFKKSSKNYFQSFLPLFTQKIGLSLLILVFACTKKTDSSQQYLDSTVVVASNEKIHLIPKKDSLLLVISPKGGYESCKSQIASKHWQFSRWYANALANKKNEIIDSASKYPTQVIVNQLFPHWYGTTWSFEGYDEIPRKSSIACGYFVSTTLVHAGFNLNRYKLAQQAPLPEIKTLHQEEQPIFFSNVRSLAELRNEISETLEEGLYIFGTSNHVGYMLHHNKQVYLIHSCYIPPHNHVHAEYLVDSEVIYKPSQISFGKITPNRNLIRQWLMNEVIQVQVP